MEIKDMVHASKQDIGAMVEASKRRVFVMEEGIRLSEVIRNFTDEMSIKIATHIGEGDGWDNEENAIDMHEGLERALKKGDYVSVANYSMFLNGLGYKPGRGN